MVKARYAHPNEQQSDRIKPAQSMYGSPVHANLPVNANSDTAARQVQPVFSPYIPPKRRDRDNPDVELCAQEDCKAFPADGYQYCIGHARKRGLLAGPKCAVDGCKASPMKTGYCYGHGEKQGLAHGDAD